MVRAIRNVEKALGSGKKKPSPSEVKKSGDRYFSYEETFAKSFFSVPFEDLIPFFPAEKIGSDPMRLYTFRFSMPFAKVS